MPKEIIVEIDAAGNVTIEGKGFINNDCAKLTEAIENALGDVTSRTCKPEFHRAAPPMLVAKGS